MRVAALALMGVVLIGCPSAYQRTYEKERGRMEQEQQQTQEREQQLHGEAQRYAAVVYFKVGSSELDAEATRQLTWFVEQMKPYPLAVIQVQGFADSTGSEASNQALSERRATAVAGFLASQGIDASRIVTTGLSEQHPAASNKTAQGRTSNRRVEVTVR